jgi:hypothetical protein
MNEKDFETLLLKRIRTDKFKIEVTNTENKFIVRWDITFTENYSLTFNLIDESTGSSINCSITDQTNKGFTVICSQSGIFNYQAVKLN